MYKIGISWRISFIWRNIFNMNTIWILASIFATLAIAEDRNSVTTESLVRKHGYPFEEHSVTTEDGYILGLHRIPYSPRNKVLNGTRRLPVAFLMHCLLCSSSDWVVVGPENALAYVLSDAGYDVWLGNNRGNSYSQKHESYNPKLPIFWNFTWHEMGMSDLPAMTDYILAKTGENQVRFLAHSKGASEFLVMNSLKPEHNSRFKSAHFFAPVAFLKNLRNIFIRLQAPLAGLPNPIREALGSFEFQPSKQLMSFIGKTVCPKDRPDRILCENVSFLVAGFNEDTVNSTVIPDVMATTPSAAAANEILHYIQLHNSGYFRQFDYGSVRNLIKYRSINPPNYPLDQINVPIFIYYGPNDSFVSKKDILKLVSELRTVKRVVEVPIPNFDHLSFMYAPNIAEKVFADVMEDFKLIP